MSFFKSTFSSNSSASNLHSTTATNTSTTTVETHNAPAKKSLTYILNNSNENYMKGHHSIGVNSLIYNSYDNNLISGGRDGQISIWKFDNNNSNKNSNNDNYDNLRSTNEIRNHIFENLENDEEIENLENSINNGVYSLSINNSNRLPKYYKNSYLHHFDWINDMKLLGDNKTIASCSNDLSIKLWNYNSDVKMTLGYHNDYIKKIGFSKNFSNHLVSGGLDKVIKIWDITKGEILSQYKFNQFNNSIYSLDVNNNLIITSGPSNIIYLFDNRIMNKPIQSFLGHTDNVRSLILKNNSFLSGSSDNSIKLWDLRSTRIIRSFEMHNSPVWSLYSPNYSNDDFSIFYSADKDGLLLKTDLRSSDLYSSNLNGYLNHKINESSGICTLIADLNYSNNINNICTNDSNNLNDNNESLSGITSIVEPDNLNTVWTSTASSTHNPNTNFISSWSIPQTGKLTVYQGLFLNRKLSKLYNKPDGSLTPNSQSQQYFNFQSKLSPSILNDNIDSSRSNDILINDAEDLVSQLSNDDLDKIDNALFSNSNGLDDVLVNNLDTLNDETAPTTGYDSNSYLNIDDYNNQNFNNEESTNSNLDNDILEFGTCFIGILGSLNTHFLFNEDYFENLKNEINNKKNNEIENDLNPFELNENDKEIQIKRKIEINPDDINEDDVILLPFNTKPISTISGISGLIKCKILNNRRHVATMDQSGCVYIFDILKCKLIQRFENHYSIDSISTFDNLHSINETNTEISTNLDNEELNSTYRFEAICNKIQTNETLPTWFSAQVKSGQLFITLEESKFTLCEIYFDEFIEYYKDFKIYYNENFENCRINLGKILINSFFYNVFKTSTFSNILEIKSKALLLENEKSNKKNIKKRNSSISITNNTTVSPLSPISNNINNNNNNNINKNTSSTKMNSSSPSSNRRGLFGRLKNKDNNIKSNNGSPQLSPISPSTPSTINNNILLNGRLKERHERYLNKVNNINNTISLIKYIEQEPEIVRNFQQYRNEYEHNSNELNLGDKDNNNLRFQYEYYHRIYDEDNSDSSPLIVINEEIHHEKKPLTTIYLDELLTNDKFSNKFENDIPIWITKGLLLNLYPKVNHNIGKIGFVLIPCKNFTNRIIVNGVDKDNLLKLSANGTLRVSRIIQFLKARIDKEKEKLTDEDIDNLEIEIICKGELLSEKSTLGTVKARTWRQSGDIVFEYCLK